MSFGPVYNLQLHNQIDRVLHVPGNYRGGILEMAVVIDCAYSADAIRVLCQDLAMSCKKQSEIFRNVHLNKVEWRKDQITSELSSLAHLQIGSCFEHYEQELAQEKAPEKLMDYLKRFQARSKLIFLLTPGENILENAEEKEALIQAMNPFLKQKLIILYPDKIEGGNDALRRIILTG